MEHVVQGPNYNVWLDALDRAFKFHSPFLGDDFVVMLVVNDITITESERAALSTEIVGQGCRYAVCTGHKSSTWDDAIDWAYLETVPDSDPPNDRFVMTTWHETDPLVEVVRFFRWHTAFDDFTPKNYMIILIGQNHEIEKETRQAFSLFFKIERRLTRSASWIGHFGEAS